MSWAPIRKVAAGIVTAVLIPAALVVLNGLDVTNLDAKQIATAFATAALPLVVAYLTPFASNEQYTKQ